MHRADDDGALPPGRQALGGLAYEVVHAGSFPRVRQYWLTIWEGVNSGCRNLPAPPEAVMPPEGEGALWPLTLLDYTLLT